MIRWYKKGKISSGKSDSVLSLREGEQCHGGNEEGNSNKAGSDYVSRKGNGYKPSKTWAL